MSKLLVLILAILCCRCQSVSVCPEIVSRANWGARAPLHVTYIPTPVQNVVVQHTVTEGCANRTACASLVKKIQVYHMEKKNFDDIGYNFLVGGDGAIYEGAGWHVEGTHTRGYNSVSLGLAFIGKFEEKLPSNGQLQAAQLFLECAVERGELSRDYKLFGARQVRNTDSPGLKLYHELETWPHFTNSPPKPVESDETVITFD